MKFQHLGVAVRNMDAALSTYRDILGYRLIAGPFTDPRQKVRVCFLRSDQPADAVIELVEPAADDSPIAGVLNRGGGAYHMCFETPRLDQTLEELLAKKCLLVASPVPAVAFNGRRIAWIYTPTRQLIELLEEDAA